MYFPQRSKVYVRLVHTTFYQRYIGLLIVLVAIGIGWFFLLYQPINKKIAWYNHQIMQLDQQNKRIANMGKKQANIAQHLATMQALFNHIKAEYCTISDTSRQIADLYTYAQEAQIQLRAYTQEKNKKETTEFSKQRANIQIAGSLDQLSTFIKQIYSASGTYLSNDFCLTNENTTNFLLRGHVIKISAQS